MLLDHAIRLQLAKLQRDHVLRRIGSEASQLAEALSPAKQMAHEYRRSIMSYGASRLVS